MIVVSKFSDFTLLICRGWHGIVLKCVPQVQHAVFTFSTNDTLYLWCLPFPSSIEKFGNIRSRRLSFLSGVLQTCAQETPRYLKRARRRVVFFFFSVSRLTECRIAELYPFWTYRYSFVFLSFFGVTLEISISSALSEKWSFSINDVNGNDNTINLEFDWSSEEK